VDALLVCAGAFGNLGAVGQDLGLLRVTGAIEIDMAAQSILGQAFPGVELFGDVRELDPATLRSRGYQAVLISSPCTSFSLAGSRDGLDSEAGALIFTCLNLVLTLLPGVVIFENSSQLSDNEDLRSSVLEPLLSRLAGAEYSCEVLRLNPTEFGGVEHRLRTYVVATHRPAGLTAPRAPSSPPAPVPPISVLDVLLPPGTPIDFRPLRPPYGWTLTSSPPSRRGSAPSLVALFRQPPGHRGRGTLGFAIHDVHGNASALRSANLSRQDLQPGSPFGCYLDLNALPGSRFATPALLHIAEAFAILEMTPLCWQILEQLSDSTLQAFIGNSSNSLSDAVALASAFASPRPLDPALPADFDFPIPDYIPPGFHAVDDAVGDQPPPSPALCPLPEPLLPPPEADEPPAAGVPPEPPPPGSLEARLHSLLVATTDRRIAQGKPPLPQAFYDAVFQFSSPPAPPRQSSVADIRDLHARAFVAAEDLTCAPLEPFFDYGPTSAPTLAPARAAPPEFLALRELGPVSIDMISHAPALRKLRSYCAGMLERDEASSRPGSKKHARRPPFVMPVTEFFVPWASPFLWDCADPECVCPILASQAPPTFNAKEFANPAEDSFSDLDILFQAEFGVHLPIPQPQFIVLCDNYASLFDKADHEESLGKAGPPLPLPRILPGVISPLGSVLKPGASNRMVSDLSAPYYAEVSRAGQNLPRLALNELVDPRDPTQFPKIRLPNPKGIARNMEILRLAALELGLDLILWAEDFKAAYNQFAVAAGVWARQQCYSAKGFRAPRYMVFGGNPYTGLMQRFLTRVISLVSFRMDKWEMARMSSGPASVTAWRRRRAECFALDRPAGVVVEDYVRLFAICGYVDDTKGMGVGLERALYFKELFWEVVSLLYGFTISPKSQLGFVSVFLGVGFDAALGEIFIPAAKVHKYVGQLRTFVATPLNSAVSVKELHSCVGRLSSVLIVLPVGRWFLLRAWSVLGGAIRAGRRHVFLPRDVCDDLRVWVELLVHCGSRPASPVRHQIGEDSPDMCGWSSDASGVMGEGAGGFFDGRWWFFPWPQAAIDFLSVNHLEFLAEVMNILTFGHRMRGSDLSAKVDSQVLCGWLSGSRVSGLAARELLVFRARLLADLNLNILPRWVPREYNCIADAATHCDEASIRALALKEGFSEVSRIDPDPRASPLVDRIVEIARTAAG